MITQFILAIFFSVINGLLSIVPTAPALPEGLISGVQSVFTLIQTAGYFLPLGTLATVLALMLLMYNIKIVMDCISWVLRKIPMING